VAIQKIQSARLITVTVDNYVGNDGYLFYDDQTGDLRLGDGVTPGGIRILASQGYTGSGGNSALADNLSSSTFTAGRVPVTVSLDGSITINGIRVGTGTTSTASGYVGSQGIVGYTGSAGGGGANNLVFSSTGSQRVLTGYVDPNGGTYSVRTTELTNGAFILNLAAFTPVLSSSVLPSSSLNWDVACTGFTVNVTNPTDFPAEWVSSVQAITQLTGTVTASTSTYTITGPNVTPAGGVSWQQTFATNASAVIRPTSSTITGGSASARITFNVKTTVNPIEQEFTNDSTSWAVSWATPALAIAMADLSGNTFLQSYAQTSYSVSVSGITNSANYSLAISNVGGSLSNSSGNGTFTFTSPIHKNNTADTRSISVAGTFTRPIAVTGSSYSAQLTSSDTVVSAIFTYPSFWVFTASTGSPPGNSDVINGTAFKTGVTALANQVKVFAGTVNNADAIPKVFWLGVRTAASQPTTFKTGASSSLLSDVTPTNGSVSLSPTPLPGGYVAEGYTLYGIVLQPGNTYVSIS
jgi:hypothetical protein